MNIEMNKNVKAYACDSIEINASIDKVFSLIKNIKDWPKWLEGVTKVTIDGNIEEGKEFSWLAKGYKLKSKIHTIVNNSEIGWTGTMLWIKAIHNWHFEKLADNKTKVTVEESFTGFLSSFMKNVLIKGIQEDLIILKKQSER
jgi:hypothetical protein